MFNVWGNPANLDPPRARQQSASSPPAACQQLARSLPAAWRQTRLATKPMVQPHPFVPNPHTFSAHNYTPHTSLAPQPLPPQTPTPRTPPTPLATPPTPHAAPPTSDLGDLGEGPHQQLEIRSNSFWDLGDARSN